MSDVGFYLGRISLLGIGMVSHGDSLKLGRL
jgi:hypothetical protein